MVILEKLSALRGRRGVPNFKRCQLGSVTIDRRLHVSMIKKSLGSPQLLKRPSAMAFVLTYKHHARISLSFVLNRVRMPAT